MPERLGTRTPGAGAIRLFVRHPTAANLLMVAMIVVGVFAVQKLNTQFFPTIEVPAVTVSVTWPGASAEDVEANILDTLEPELRFLDDIDKTTSVAREGAGVITMEFAADADMQKAQSDVEQAVAGVTTLPEDSETPEIKRITFYEPVAKVAVSGPFSEKVLKHYAKQLRDGLLVAGIDRVTFTGARKEEVWVRVRERELRRLGMTLGDIAQRVREDTSDQPSGTLRGDVEMQLRSLAERRTPETIRRIEVKSDAAGNKVPLGDIAEVTTRFDDDDLIGQRYDRRAIELSVQRAVTADTLKTMAILNGYLAAVAPTLPPTLTVEKYDVRGELVTQRLGILIRNGVQGLMLVLLILFVFLNTRIAFWVAAGIPVAFMATLAVMWASGQTINMVSMFGLIMMLGIIVDDAIVVGEHTATRQAMGDGAVEAAERGAMRMLAPVMAATLTTLAAFFPIFLVSGRIGDVMAAIPLVVIAVLVASVVECFLILPGHLRHGFGRLNRPPGRLRTRFDGGLKRFTKGPYRRLVRLAFAWRYTTLALTIALFILAIGLIAGGRVGFHFFPSPEPENIIAEVTFAAGTAEADQMAALTRIEQSLRDVETTVNGGAEALVRASFTTLGQAGQGFQLSRSDNLAQIEVQLTASERRNTPTNDIIRAWQDSVPEIPGVERVAIVAQRAGPPGRDIDIRLQDAPIAGLKAAAEAVKQALTGYPGVLAIDDDLPYGKRELILEATPRGAALGFTADMVGTQVRNAFEGAIATRFPRGDEEITVRVRLLQDTPGLHALRTLYLRSPGGQFVPLPEVVKIREKTGFAVIQRRDGLRTVSVTGDIDAEVTSVSQVLEGLSRDLLPRLAADHGLKYSFAGREEDRQSAFADLRLGAMVALTFIYIILAWVFESYFKPLAVMAIIPFGLVGAVLGHMAMGVPLTIVSLIGLLGLSGILVNDSIILVAAMNERIKRGSNLAEAAVGASEDRLRAVLLTSLTTMGGLLPLMFEKSLQAQFLIPIAITFVFGLGAATLLVLFLVPALMGIGQDLGRVGGALRRLYGRPTAAGAGGDERARTRSSEA